MDAPLLAYIADHEARYPAVPGSKGNHGTSERAAREVKSKAHLLRERCLDALREGGQQTSDEVAARLHESILSVRPRLSELFRLGQITDAGIRRTNSISGKLATVWAIKTGPLQGEASGNDGSQVVLRRAA